MTTETWNKYNSKWPEAKIVFNLHIFLTKCIRVISCVRFFVKKILLVDFSIKKEEHPHVCGGVFVDSSQIGVLCDSQATNRSELERGGGSHMESFLLPIVILEVICDFQPHGYGTFHSHPD
jgi:hypothetical protein